MNDGPANTSLPTAVKRQIDHICDDFESAWKSDNHPRIEDLLVQMPAKGRSQLLYELLKLEVELRQAAGESVMAAKYHQRFPQHSETIDMVLARFGQTQTVLVGDGETARRRSIANRARTIRR
ncbi:MAG: hypothetical protein ABGZ53_26475 [Fuerstiella sp.]